MHQIELVVLSILLAGAVCIRYEPIQNVSTVQQITGEVVFKQPQSRVARLLQTIQGQTNYAADRFRPPIPQNLGPPLSHSNFLNFGIQKPSNSTKPVPIVPIPKTVNRILVKRFQYKNCLTAEYYAGTPRPLKCEKCLDNNYKYNDTVCLSLDPNCRTWAQNVLTPKCQRCYPGYMMGSKGFCILDFRKCKQFDGKNKFKCVKCAYPYIRVNDACGMDDFVCQQIAQDRQLCKSCWIGFQLNSDGVCFNTAESQCETFFDDPLLVGKCQKCYSDKYQVLVDGKCYNKNQRPGLVTS